VEIGLLVLAVSAGAPLLPRKLLGIGDGAYVFSLVVITSVLAVLVVPAWLALLGSQFNTPPRLSPTDVALVLATSFFAPLVAGMVVRGLFPALAEWLAARVVGIAGIALLLGALGLLAMQWEIVLTIQWTGVFALVALIALALAIGHVLGGPADDDRTALAIACATRHIGVAVMVATSLPGPRAAVILSVYIGASAAVSLPYLHWRRARARAAIASPSLSRSDP
jgi:bile acid:Na+ symporter, BASS family